MQVTRPIGRKADNWGRHVLMGVAGKAGFWWHFRRLVEGSDVKTHSRPF